MTTYTFYPKTVQPKPDNCLTLLANVSASLCSDIFFNILSFQKHWTVSKRGSKIGQKIASKLGCFDNSLDNIISRPQRTLYRRYHESLDGSIKYRLLLISNRSMLFDDFVYCINLTTGQNHLAATYIKTGSFHILFLFSFLKMTHVLIQSKLGRRV